jgi:O-antigen ligase
MDEAIAAAESSWPVATDVLDVVQRAIVAVALFAIPILVTPSAFDAYRQPKEMLLRAAAILIAAIAASRFVLAPSRIVWDNVRTLTIVAVAWTLVTALASRNRTLSAESLAFVASAAVVFMAVYSDARRGSRVALNAVIASASIVGALSIIARFSGSHSYFLATMEGRSVGLLGSASDTATYLSFTALAAIALAYTDAANRKLYAIAAAVMIGGLLATQTLGALAGFVIGILVMTFVASRRRGAIGAGIIIVAVLAATLLYAPLRKRITTRLHAPAAERLDVVLAGRTVPMIAAWKMLLDRPLVGVGPGCFGFEYFNYKLRVEDEYPSLIFTGSRTEMFGEVHNDHLQMLAQSGLPGYALFVIALVLVARVTFRSRDIQTDEQSFARFLGAPLAITLAIIAMAEFPLELAAPVVTLLALAATVLAWRRDVTPA